MKTSASQFELLVTFMEQHGDLSKPTSDPNGRIKNLKSWERLASVLNSDGSGDTKSTDKWKKVWSDYKNNTKKKAARIHRAARGTGGGPANFTRLSDLENRVLNLIGVQVATGLAVEEAGVSQRAMPISAATNQPVDSPLQLNLDAGDVMDRSHSWDQPGQSNRPHIAPTLPTSEATLTPSVPSVLGEVEVETTRHGQSFDYYTPARVVASPQMFASIEVQDGSMLTPTRNLSPSIRGEDTTSAVSQPALFGQTQPVSSERRVSEAAVHSRHTTPRRARPIRTRGSPRRRVRPTNTEQAAEHFLRSDEEWRKFKIEQHRDHMELRREQNRIRNSEIQVQRDWILLASRALDSVDKLVNKYCNN